MPESSRIDVGGTGSQHGCTPQQLSTFQRFISIAKSYRNGVCIGADEQTSVIAHEAGVEVIGYPPIKPNKRSKRLDLYNRLFPPKPYLERNTDIVLDSKVIIALPSSGKEQLRSGTWATVRRARFFKKPLAIILPDGNVSYERDADKIFQGL